MRPNDMLVVVLALTLGCALIIVIVIVIVIVREFSHLPELNQQYRTNRERNRDLGRRFAPSDALHPNSNGAKPEVAELHSTCRVQLGDSRYRNDPRRLRGNTINKLVDIN